MIAKEQNSNLCIDSGFLVVKTFPTLYRDYLERYRLTQDVYALPRIDKSPEEYKIHYHGLDRDALDPFVESDNLAEIRLAELEKEERCIDGFLFDPEDVRDVLSFLENKEDYEVVWTRAVQAKSVPPNGYQSIGYEPTYFLSDHFSASCDCMLIPRWHGTDEEGTLFKEYFQRLNMHGLFFSRVDASEFLNYYLSFDWTETGDYEIAEDFLY